MSGRTSMTTFEYLNLLLLGIDRATSVLVPAMSLHDVHHVLIAFSFVVIFFFWCR